MFKPRINMLNKDNHFWVFQPLVTARLLALLFGVRSTDASVRSLICVLLVQLECFLIQAFLQNFIKVQNNNMRSPHNRVVQKRPQFGIKHVGMSYTVILLHSTMLRFFKTKFHKYSKVFRENQLTLNLQNTVFIYFSLTWCFSFLQFCRLRNIWTIRIFNFVGSKCTKWYFCG